MAITHKQHTLRVKERSINAHSSLPKANKVTATAEAEMVKLWWWWRWSSPFALILAAFIGGVCGGNVTYDGRSLIVDGQHRILFSGSIHYPRSTPQVRNLAF